MRQLKSTFVLLFALIACALAAD